MGHIMENIYANIPNLFLIKLMGIYILIFIEQKFFMVGVLNYKQQHWILWIQNWWPFKLFIEIDGLGGDHSII